MKTNSPFPAKRLMLAAGLALALPLSALAYSGYSGKAAVCDGSKSMHGASMMHGGGMSSLRGLHRLDLSEAQQDKVFEIMHSQAPALRDQMKALRQSERELQALKDTPDYSDAKARTLIDKIARQRADMEMSRLQNERKLMDVLTPEQRKQLSEMKPAKRDGRGPQS